MVGRFGDIGQGFVRARLVPEVQFQAQVGGCRRLVRVAGTVRLGKNTSSCSARSSSAG